MDRILVLGAGLSGLAAGKLAVRHGLSVTIYDSDPPLEAVSSGIGLASGKWDHLLLNGVDLVVASPGFAERSLPIVDSLELGLLVWSEIEFASSFTGAPIVAITGTNGKTTVTEATAMMLESSGIDAPATGNIGYPLSDYVDGDHEVLVVETSSFQLRFIESFHPVAAGVTNVAVDHLDWHGSAAAYAAAKRNIYKNQTSEDLIVYDADDEGAAALIADSPSERFPVSGRNLPDGGGGVSGSTLVVGDVNVDVEKLEIRDPVHLTNLAMSAALALRMGAIPDAVEGVATSFRPGAHRRQLVLESAGIRWVDDSKATNPHAALASIRSHDRVILIAGGLAKGTDVRSLAHEPNLVRLLGIGESGAEIAEEAGRIGELAETLDAAVRIAAREARPGDTVLLAPGCASFDQFDSYAQRGDRFQELVRDLETEGAIR